MYKDLKIVCMSSGKPVGIRDSGGYLFFFTDITRYHEQEERYEQEIKEQNELANYLLDALIKRSR